MGDQAESSYRDQFVKLLFEQGLMYKDIVVLLKEYGFVISLRHLKRILRKLQLYRRKYTDIREVIEFIHRQLADSGQLHGYRTMLSRCRLNGIAVRASDVRLILRQLDPRGVDSRTARRFRRRAYFAAGPNFIWHIDGYDKLKHFGLCVSGCICGFSRKIIWLNVYHTNNNPRIIGGYFLEAVKRHGGCPRLVRGDLGTENGLVRNFQTFFWRNGNNNRRVYIDGTSTSNQRIESWWAYLRANHLHFWIELLNHLQDAGDYRGDFLDKNVVLFCFTALIQDELDTAMEMWNSHNIRRSRNQNVPSGHPNIMYHFPSLWDRNDYTMHVSDDDFTECVTQAEFRSTIPCDADIFEICSRIMRDTRLQPPRDAQEATDLYLYLRREITTLLAQ